LSVRKGGEYQKSHWAEGLTKVGERGATQEPQEGLEERQKQVLRSACYPEKKYLLGEKKRIALFQAGRKRKNAYSKTLRARRRTRDGKG